MSLLTHSKPMKVLFLLLLLSTAVFAENYSADPSCRSFEMKERKKHRVDTFDFEGEYPDLENIDIDGRRKKNVEFYLTGEYPKLEKVNYEGAFGILEGHLTGTFPKLSKINFLCSSCAMKLDFRGEWAQSCAITITGAKEDISILLPKEVGLVIHTKTSAKGRVIPCEELKKKNKLGILNKNFENELASTASIVLTINIEVTEGSIILK